MGTSPQNWKRLDAGASRLERNLTKPSADRLELVLQCLDQVKNIFSPGDETPEGKAVYHLAAAVSASLKGLSVFPAIEDMDLPAFDAADLKCLEEVKLEDLTPMDLSELLPEAGTCPMCGSQKKKG